MPGLRLDSALNWFCLLSPRGLCAAEVRTKNPDPGVEWLLGLRHYAGLPCHLIGCTQAVPWPAQGPGLCAGAKVPLRDNFHPLLVSGSSRSLPSLSPSINSTPKLCLHGVVTRCGFRPTSTGHRKRPSPAKHLTPCLTSFCWDSLPRTRRLDSQGICE